MFLLSSFTSLFANKKIVYFVRHGESKNNAGGIRQGSAGGLSDLGKQQAAFLGERLKNSGIQAILASPYERTQETARIIASSFKEPFQIETSALLQERRNPSDIIGKPVDDPEVAKIIELIDKKYHDDDFRFSDEENFNDLKQRAKTLLEYIDRRPERHILIVTHRIFLKFVVCYIGGGENFHAHDFTRLDYLNTVHPAGVTITEYNPRDGKKGNQGWNLLAWDDYGHFQEQA